MWVLIGVA
jgi:hypothetical protein